MQEKEVITEIVKSYFLGTYHGDAEKLRNIFHPDAHVTGIFHGQIVDWNLNDFIQRVTSGKSAAENNEKFNKEILFIDQMNDAAIVRARVVVGENTFTDYITLLRIDGKWKIRNKSFTT